MSSQPSGKWGGHPRPQPDPQIRLAGFQIAIAGALPMVTLAPSWSTAISLGGPNAGLMGAVMNTAGQIGGILSPIVLSRLRHRA